MGHTRANLQQVRSNLADTVISYAQNREDLLLYWLLGQKTSGFYVDVGANDPVDFSITKFFYDSGWSGLNIEPIDSLFQKIVIARPRDINLKLGIATKKGTLKLREYTGADGLSTFSQSEQKALGDKYEYRDYEVPVETLAAVMEANLPAKTTIDFMKIDVEGFEYEVLSSNDWKRYRPSILCIEANHVFHDWRPLLLETGYELVYFDGINEYWAQDAASVRARYKDYADIFLPGRVIEQQRYAVRREQLEQQNSNLLARVERLLEEQHDLNLRLAKMAEDNNFLNNLPIKGSLKQLAKAIYRSLRFRALRLIWGSTNGYKASTELAQLNTSSISSAAEAARAIAVINSSDASNASLLLRSARVRRFVYERVRSAAIFTRKLIRGKRSRT